MQTQIQGAQGYELLCLTGHCLLSSFLQKREVTQGKAYDIVLDRK